jgi:hypothetical protein
VAELANASVVHPSDLGSNLNKDWKYFLILFVLHLNSNLKGVNSWALFVNKHVYCQIMLDPNRHVVKHPKHNVYVERHHLKMCIDWTTEPWWLRGLIERSRALNSQGARVRTPASPYMTNYNNSFIYGGMSTTNSPAVGSNLALPWECLDVRRTIWMAATSNRRQSRRTKRSMFQLTLIHGMA